MIMCMLVGCAVSPRGKDEDASTANQNDQYVLCDSLSSESHFISAPAKQDGAEAVDGAYTVSFTTIIDHTDVSLVLSDGQSDLGSILMFEIRETDETGELVTREVQDGLFKTTEDDSAHLFFDVSDNHTYSLEMSIDGGKAYVSVNGDESAQIDIPSIDVRSVGFYVNRGSAPALVDDLCLTDSKGETVIADDFEGNAINRLYPYRYAGDRTCIFDPCYYRIAEDDGNHMLHVGDGMILTEAEQISAPLFRREFNVNKDDVSRAYISMTALGSVDMILNGQPVTKDYFAPGRCAYDDYLNFVSYDVTDLLADDNTFDVYLFRGFYTAGSGSPDALFNWGNAPAINGDIVIEYKNGETTIIPTNNEYRVCTDTGYRYNDIYQGEMIDERYSDTDEHTWEKVSVDSVDEKVLKLPVYPKKNPMIREVETIKCVDVTNPAPGRYVYDFGRNFAGTVRIDSDAVNNLKMEDGQVITFRYGELLNGSMVENDDDLDGTIWTYSLLTAGATDYYVFGGSCENDLSFEHTYHGFRYMELSGVDEALPADAVVGIALSSAIRDTGDFVSSSEIINHMYTMATYSLQNNLMDIPTDCCQRDERLGWMGDAQITMPFASYSYDLESFYENYLDLVCAQQGSDGAFPDLAPSSRTFGGKNCWGDAAVIIAWNMYLQYGNKKVIEDHYEDFRSWADYLNETGDDYIRISDGYGDHLSLQSTNEAITDTAWSEHTNRLVGKMAGIMKLSEDEAKYTEYADRYRESWQRHFIRENPSVEAGILNAEDESETAYSLGIMFGLFPEDMGQAAADRLKMLTEYGNYIFYPGYSGMSFYLPALAKGGYVDDAIAVLENTNEHGFAYPYAVGLTSLPESIHFIIPGAEGSAYTFDGSLNHMAYSSVCTFVYTHLLGIVPDEKAPGYDHFYIQPCIGERLRSASGSYLCRHGLIEVSWDADARTMECTIPEGSVCTLILPDGTKELQAGKYTFEWQ